MLWLSFNHTQACIQVSVHRIHVFKKISLYIYIFLGLKHLSYRPDIDLKCLNNYDLLPKTYLTPVMFTF